MLARLTMTEVQTLSHQSKAALDASVCLKSSLSTKSNSGPYSKSMLRKHQRLAGGRYRAHRSGQVLRPKCEDEKKQSERWRSAALKSDEDALDSRTLLQDLISEQETCRYHLEMMRLCQELGKKCQANPSVFTQRETFLHNTGENPAPGNDPLREKILDSKENITCTSLKHWISGRRTNSQNNKLEFEQWPHGTRFKHWKT